MAESAALKWPSMYDLCPSCGKHKTRKAALCSRCENPDVFRTKPGEEKRCTNCGLIKDGRHPSWCRRCVCEQIKSRYKNNPEVAKELRRRGAIYKKNQRDEFGSPCQKYRRRIREVVIREMGGKCSSSSCMWINDDDTVGCDDIFCLQIDHIHGNGLQDRKQFKSKKQFYEDVLKNRDKYQLLCANCNWRKRYDNEEHVRGGWGK